MISRRDLLKRGGALAVGAVGAGALACTGEEGSQQEGDREERDREEGNRGEGSADERALQPSIGVQLYTVRALMEESVPATLEKVAAIGYGDVEFAGYFGHPPGDIRTMLADAGLSAPSSHVEAAFAPESWARILADALEAGHRYVIVPWLPPEMRTTLDDWKRTADAMNRAASMARATGLRFAYHNHAFEFERGEELAEGRTFFDVFLEEADADLVEVELDVFWITDAESDPLAFLDRWSERVPMIHVKDRTLSGEMVDVGDGVIGWSDVFARLQAGTLRFVEHDEPRNPTRSIERSFAALQRIRS